MACTMSYASTFSSVGSAPIIEKGLLTASDAEKHQQRKERFQLFITKTVTLGLFLECLSCWERKPIRCEMNKLQAVTVIGFLVCVFLFHVVKHSRHILKLFLFIIIEGVNGKKPQVTSDQLLGSPSKLPCICL